jgi:hypothetical protein
MTKSELFAVLADVPDEAEIYVGGAEIRAVVRCRDGDGVVLDDDPRAFWDDDGNGDKSRFLFGPASRDEYLAERDAAVNEIPSA